MYITKTLKGVNVKGKDFFFLFNVPILYSFTYYIKIIVKADISSRRATNFQI